VNSKSENFVDAIIIGAGIAGMYQLYKLRELGLSVRLFETGTGVGGTWYWNRYPGCRFDSESYSYGYSFSDEVLQEWNWSEHFSPQPETLRYLNFVADKFDLRKDIQFNSRVASASYDEGNCRWLVELEDGSQATARYLISATGPLSAPTLPAVDGIDSFKGESFHTSRWPKAEDGLGGKQFDFSGKRIGVVGTGASGVQVIQEIAKTAGELLVFQRNPNWCAPLHNSQISDAEQQKIKANYDQIFQACRDSFGSFLHDFDPRSALEVTDQEREALFEKLYGDPGFGIWLGNFHDILTDVEANKLISDFVADKIRGRVNDPQVAEKLIPKNHGFGTRRVPMETRYFEVYNQDNVTLVDLRETPIERITPDGIETAGQHYDLDMIIYATGFDAVSGALNRIDISGIGGQKLKDKWVDGPRTLLGLQIAGFPNLFTLVGPHNGASFCNIPRCIEQNVEWVTDLMAHMRDNNLKQIQANTDAEDRWTQEVNEAAEATLFPTADSWFMGVNNNVPGKKRSFMLYVGGSEAYREACDQVAQSGYTGFSLT